MTAAQLMAFAEKYGVSADTGHIDNDKWQQAVEAGTYGMLRDIGTLIQALASRKLA